MIELFNLVKRQREKSIKIKCDRVSYWRTESEKVNKFIKYIENNINKFCIEKMEIKYDTDVVNEQYVKSFDLIIYTDNDTYKYLKEEYGFLLEKYDKYTINLDDIRFHNLASDNLRRLRIH